MRGLRVLVAVGIAALLAPASEAALVTYTDRSAFLAAIGYVYTIEDFEGFVADTQFRTQTVALSVGVIGQTGLGHSSGTFRNQVDVLPLVFPEGFTSNAASCYVNAPDAGAGSETAVRLALSPFGGSWGAEFSGVTGPTARGAADGSDGDGAARPEVSEGVASEGLIVNVYGNGGQLLDSFDRTDTGNSFFGIVGTEGESIESIQFVHATTIAGDQGEGFNIDDVIVGGNAGSTLVQIPALSASGLAALALGLAAAALTAARRRSRLG
jgi:hypothetical protein